MPARLKPRNETKYQQIQDGAARTAICEIWHRHGCDPDKSSEELGISRSTLYREIARLNLADELRSKPVYTYFIQRGQRGPIKIGITTDVAARLVSLSTGSSDPLRVLGTIYGDKEAELHKEFKMYRMHGEWFRSSPPVLARARAANNS